MRDPMKFKDFKLSELKDEQLLKIERELFEQLQIVRGEVIRRRLHAKPVVVVDTNVKVEKVGDKRRKKTSYISFVETDDDVSIDDIEIVVEGMKRILQEEGKK